MTYLGLNDNVPLNTPDWYLDGTPVSGGPPTVGTLVPQQVTLKGLTPTTVAATSGGDQFPADDRTWVEITNGSGSPITASLDDIGLGPGDVAIPDKTVTIAAGATAKIGPPLPLPLFRDPTTGYATVHYSSVTTVTVACLRI